MTPDGLGIKVGDRVWAGDQLWAGLQQLGHGKRRVRVVEDVDDRPAVGSLDGSTERFIKRDGIWHRAEGWEVAPDEGR